MNVQRDSRDANYLFVQRGATCRVTLQLGRDTMSRWIQLAFLVTGFFPMIRTNLLLNCICILLLPMGAFGAQDTAHNSLSGNPPAEPSFLITVKAVDFDRENAIITGRIDPSIARPASEVPVTSVMLSDKNGVQYRGQVSEPSIHDKDGGKRVTFVVPKLGKGVSLEIAEIDWTKDARDQFSWKSNEEGVAGLSYGSRRVMSYMHRQLDESTDELRQQTYKVFHHVYTPDGSRLMTKGPGGLFPHHRGVFYGFNLISYGEGKTADVWHCKDGAHQVHFNSLDKIAGHVFGRDVNIVNWHGKDGDIFATEYREMTAYNIPDAIVIDFRSRLETKVGPISLKGDPQHAGFQFRASQDVPDNTKALTYYIRPDGKAEPGDFRNWSAKSDETDINKSHINLPFNAACIALPCKGDLDEELENRRFTVCYLDHPSNPKPSRFSERDYARFGSYFEYELTKEKPLNVRYRIWIQEGEMSVEEIKHVSDAFAATSE